MKVVEELTAEHSVNGVLGNITSVVGNPLLLVIVSPDALRAVA